MFVYIIKADGAGTIKIGKANNPGSRLIELQVGCPFPLRMLRQIDCAASSRALVIEQIGHDLLKPYAVRGEWFKHPPDEVFSKIVSVLINCAKGRFEPDDLLSIDEAKKLAAAAIAVSKTRLKRQHKRNRHKGFARSQMKAALRED